MEDTRDREAPVGPEHHPHPGDDATPQPAAVRPSVVFVHGMRTSGAIWDAQLDAVHDAGYRATAIDLPGHGVRRRERFTMQGAFDAIDEAAADLADPASEARATPLALVGLSLGGYTSLAYAARAPEQRGGLLRGVVAASCSTNTRGLPLRTFQAGLHGSLAAGRLTRELGGRAAARLSRLVLPPPTRRALAGGRPPASPPLPVVRASQTPGWDLVADALRHLAGESSVRNLRASDVPVWLVNGARDQLRMQERRHARAAARLVVVPGAGHDVSLEAPAAFNAAVLDALAAFGPTRA
ncbi:lysophospholipase [Luteimicrobium album]|uniref:Lysophospholipase n=1 Tax=Luteimicrobium album TaxID=1054550 RepID=A0ABQ6HVI8_9MICO|nr:alpha/beta hydrolase [Luteimicrobium album]GMA22524.1 lysophospholipase [Luteimicrobium album]